MGKWVETEYGQRYKEDYGTCAAFFMGEPDKDGKRMLPAEAVKIIVQSKLCNTRESADK